MLALILCILVSVSPLLHLAGKTFPLPTNPLLLIWGSWLPYDLHVSSPQRASMITTNDIEFLLLIALAFGIYALCASLIWQQPASIDYKPVVRLIWLGTIIAGLIYVLTPAMLS